MRHVRTLTIAVLTVGASLQAAAQQPAPSTLARVARSAPPSPRSAGRILPGTRPEAFTTIQGNALNSTNGTLSDASVRLRDARFGRIVDTTTTDKAGLFAFRSIDPGSYIVELVGADQGIIAASQILNVNAGEAASAIVKIPFRIPPFAGVLGHSAPSAAVVTTSAAASGVLATEVSGGQKSPRQ